MRKVMDKIFGVVAFSVALIMIILLLVTVAGGFQQTDLDNKVVKALLYALAAIFLFSGSGYIYITFHPSRRVNEVLVYHNERKKVNVTKPVIKKLILHAVGESETIKVKHVKLSVIDSLLHFVVFVEITDSDVPRCVDYLEALIKDQFSNTLKLDKYTMDFKVKKLDSKYEVPRDEIKKEVELAYEEQSKEEKTEENNEQSASDEQQKDVTGTAETESKPAEEAKSAAKPHPHVKVTPEELVEQTEEPKQVENEESADTGETSTDESES
jgi:hypothetical protein